MPTHFHGEAISLFSQAEASAGAVPEWVHILPAGNVVGADGRAFRVGNLETIIAASMARAPAKTLPIDYDHQIDLAPKAGGNAPAAGWMNELQARADGIWARVEWTPRARAHIAGREYRFISPALRVTPQGEVRLVARAALTNNPNLSQLTALNAAGAPMDMEQLLPTLRELLTLPADADGAAVVQAVRDKLTSLNTPDPARFVPMELFQKSVEEANKANRGLSLHAAERMVDDAIRDRLVMPWMREWAVSLCATNAPAFQDFTNGVGKSINGFLKNLETPHDWSLNHAADRSAAGRPVAGNEIAARLGLSAEDLAKYGK